MDLSNILMIAQDIMVESNKMSFWDQIRSIVLSKNTKYLTVSHGELSLIADPDKKVKNWVPHILLLTAQPKSILGM